MQLSGAKQVLRGSIGQTKSCLLVLFATLIICAIVIALAVLRKRQVLELEAKSSSENNWEVKREDVNIEVELGKGCFGTVYKGTLKQVK